MRNNEGVLSLDLPDLIVYKSSARSHQVGSIQHQQLQTVPEEAKSKSTSSQPSSPFQTHIINHATHIQHRAHYKPCHGCFSSRPGHKASGPTGQESQYPRSYGKQPSPQWRHSLSPRLRLSRHRLPRSLPESRH